jgi:hypothetical protein
MKDKTEKPTIVINILSNNFSGNQISLSEKSQLFILIAILILVVSNYEPSLLVILIRLLFDNANNF